MALRYAWFYPADSGFSWITLHMKLAGFLVCVALIGLGFHFFRVCSNRFMLLRHAKSFTPYWWGIAGILSLMMITLAAFAGLFLILGRFR